MHNFVTFPLGRAETPQQRVGNHNEPTMDSKTVALNYLKASDNSDYATIEKLFGARHQFHSSMSPEPMNAEQHLMVAKGFNSGFSNTRHEVIDVIESGSKVVVRGNWHGTHTGLFNNIPASGKTVRLPFIMIVEVENGEMINHWVEMDSMSFMMQLGAIPSPAAVN
jgi:steroid delta-isomerase-like uncharacterized protein